MALCMGHGSAFVQCMGWQENSLDMGDAEWEVTGFWLRQKVCEQKQAPRKTVQRHLPVPPMFSIVGGYRLLTSYLQII